VLKHASRSRHIDPNRPPAAAGGLRSQVPDLVHGPRELLDCRQLQQVGRRERTRFFDRRSRAGVDLAASAITLWAVRASTDEQRTGYALGVAIVQTVQRRSHDVRVMRRLTNVRQGMRLTNVAAAPSVDQRKQRGQRGRPTATHRHGCPPAHCLPTGCSRPLPRPQ
jgi:hypothetical protein